MPPAVCCRRYEFVPAGEPVYREGEFGESMYIILSGTCDVFPVAGSRLPSDTGLLHMGQAFGELALVAARKPRSRTVAASTAGGGSSSGPAQQQGGVHLATLHRSSLSHMRFVAAASAFKKLPGDMVRRLAADAGHVRLPAGRLVFEEDAPGHCMYVVLSSARESSVSRVTAAAEAEAAEKAGGGSDGEGLGVPVGGGGRGGGWGGMGFTTLLTVRAARKARERHPDAEEDLNEEHGEEGEEGQEALDGPSRKAAGAPAAPARDSPFWIARFMEDALKRLHVGDSAAGLGQAMTPLAAVAAARWRQAAAARHSNTGIAAGAGAGAGAGVGAEAGKHGEGLAEGADAAAIAAAEGDGQAMEALLGRAAARALRAAVSTNRLRDAGAAAAGKKHDGGAYAEEEEQEDVLNPAEAVAASGLAATAKAGAAGGGLKQADAEGQEEDDAGQDVPGPLQGHHAGHLLTEPSLRVHGAGGTAGGRLTAVEDPAKRLLSQRADVSVVLYEVAKNMVRRGGGPRRISRTASKQINRALQQQLRAGPDLLQPTVQGQRVLGRHPSVGHGAGYYGAGGGGGGGGGALRVSGEGPWGGAGEQAPRVSMGGSTATWGPEGNRRSYNGGGGVYGTRPASAMTSGASVFHTEGGTTEYDDYEDDATDLDWNGSDLFSVASYGRRSTGMVGGGGSQYGGRRRTTLQDLPDIMAHQDINTDLLSPAELDAVYGPVLRVVGPGQSFGELALLHREARRTATVVALPPSAASLGPVTSSGAVVGAASAAAPPSLPVIAGSQGLTPELSSASLHGSGGGDGPAVDLICIHRHTYNHTVRAVQVQEGEVVLLDSSCGVAETLMAPAPGAARTALLRNISAPAGRNVGGSGGGGSGGPQPAHQLGPGGPGGRLLLRQLSAPEVQRVVAAGGRLPPVPLGVRQDNAGGGGGRVMFDSGASAAEQQRAAASGAAPDGPLRHVAPGALLALGGTLAALGAGGVFGEGLLANLHKEQPPVPGAAWEDDAASSKGSSAASRAGRPRPLRHAAPPPPPHPCTVIARRPTRLLYISAHDLSRFAELVAEPLSELAEARGDFLATRTASVSAAKEAVAERVAGARRVLNDLRHMQAAGVPVASNPRLLEDLRREQVAAAAATAAESEYPPPPVPTAAEREAAEAAAAIRMIQAAGGRVRALLPGGGVGLIDLTATAARGKPPTGRVSSARSARSGSSGGGGAGQPLNRFVQQLHPIAGRLAACLQESTPKLPPRLPPTPPADGDGYRPTLRQASAASSAAAHSLSTIQEESSSGMLRAAGAGAARSVGGEMTDGGGAGGVLLTQRRDLMAPDQPPASVAAAAVEGVAAVESSGELWREDGDGYGDGDGTEHDQSVELEVSEETVLPHSAAAAAAAVHNTEGAVKKMAEQLQSFYQLLGQVPGSRDGARPATGGGGGGGLSLTSASASVAALASPGQAAASPQLPPLHSTASLGRTDSRRRLAHSGFAASPSTSFTTRTAPGGLLLTDSAANTLHGGGEYAPPSLGSMSQASLRSYPSIGPTASVVAAGLTSMGGPLLVNESSGGSSGGGGGAAAAAAASGRAARPDSAESDTPARLYAALCEGGSMGGGARGLLPALHHPHRQALLASGGPLSRGSHGDGDSITIYSDDGSTSPDLSMLSRETLGAMGAGVGAGVATGGGTPGAVSPPLLSHPRRPMAAVRRSTSNISEGLVQLLGGTPGDMPSTPTAATGAAASGPGSSGSGGARVSLSGGPAGSDGRIIEAPGAALDVLMGGRPRPLSRGDSLRSMGGGRRTNSMSGGAGSNRVSLNGAAGGAPASPYLDLLSAAVAAATSFGAATEEAGVAAGVGDSASAVAAADAAARAPLQLLTPMESINTEAHQQATSADDATAAAHAAAASEGADADSDAGAGPGGDGPLLPWSYVDGTDSPQPQPHPDAEPLVPPLSLAALKLRPRIMGEEYSSDGGSLGGAESDGGAGPRACSPRAAMTDSPLRARRGAGGFESPAHSPRLVSHVY
eukprot:XP_001701011.1 predicted protein [Chlamydomonas reinhardtii]